MKTYRIIILVITVASLIANSIFVPEKRVDENAYLKEVAPDIIFSKKKIFK